MLSAINRLRRSHEITRVYRRGRYGNGGDVSCKSLANGLAESRVAVVVSKKVSKRAVRRNRLRRRITGSLRERWATVAPGYDIVITVHRDLVEMTPRQLELALDQALAASGARHRN